jgi:hypothetical protein
VLPADRLPFPDNSVEEIYTSHMVEHWPRSEFPAALHEWHRVLKPGGRLRIRCPNFELYVREWLEGDYDYRWGRGIINIFGHDDRGPGTHHFTGFTAERLDRLLSENGFETLSCEVTATIPEYDNTVEYRPDGDICYEGTKVVLPKVLYVDSFSTPIAQTGIKGLSRAYRKVALLKTFDYRNLAQRYGRSAMNRLLVETAVRFKPGLVHLGKAELIDGRSIREIKRRTDACVIHFYRDFRLEPQPEVVGIGQYADCTLFQWKDAAEIKKYQDLGVFPIGFWCQGVDPDVMYPKDVPRTQEVAFMANNWNFLEGHQERRDLINAILYAGTDLHVYGIGWEYLRDRPNAHLHPLVLDADFAKACSAAKITLGIGSVSNVYMYTSWPRLFNSMACGAFHLARYFPGLETVFENQEHLVWFHSIPEAVELIQYYLAHDEERETIARAGRQEVLAQHTWDHRVAEMFKYLEQCQVPVQTN